MVGTEVIDPQRFFFAIKHGVPTSAWSKLRSVARRPKPIRRVTTIGSTKRSYGFNAPSAPVAKSRLLTRFTTGA